MLSFIPYTYGSCVIFRNRAMSGQENPLGLPKVNTWNHYSYIITGGRAEKDAARAVAMQAKRCVKIAMGFADGRRSVTFRSGLKILRKRQIEFWCLLKLCAKLSANFRKKHENSILVLKNLVLG